ncbi:hypothetical protein B296_00054788, partial [Ensete ventricosum]
APPRLRQLCPLSRRLRSQICWKGQSPASSLATDLRSISCFLPRRRSVIALRPGQIVRLHRVRPCVAASRARRTAAYPAASPSSVVPRGTAILQSPCVQKIVYPPHLTVCQKQISSVLKITAVELTD